MADVVSVYPDKLDFGNTAVTAYSLQFAFISNPTKKDLNISSITAGGDFWIPPNFIPPSSIPPTTQPCSNVRPFVLPAGTQCVILVAFTPTALGPATATLTVTDDATNSPQKVKLSGTGVPVQLSSISVTPANSSVPQGQLQPFTATGNYNNGTIQDLTNSVTWASSATNVAAILGSGFAVTQGQGATTISASAGAVTGSTSLTVTPPIVTSILVAPSSATVAKGKTQQFSATAIFSNNTRQNVTNSAQWSSSAALVAGVDATGVATGLGQGNATISASVGSVTGSAQLTVTPPVLTSVSLTPSNVSIGGGSTQQFTFIGTYSDASTQNLTASSSWYTSNSSVASISASGRALGFNPGFTTITAWANQGVFSMGNASLEVAFYENISPMTSPRSLHTSTLFLNPSKNPQTSILLAGGATQFSGGTILASTDILDFYARVITAGPVMNVAREGHTATLLPAGQVLIAGGQSPSGVVASSEVFDPSSNLFTFAGDMTTPRVGHTATLLNTGKVLITGGSTPSAEITSSAEIYDPSTGAFTATGSMAVSRLGHTATLLLDGRVLIAGGQGTTLAELYDPAAGTFTAAGNLTTERRYLAAALLTNGTVLLTGGFLTGNPTPLASAEIYDPVARTFTATANTMSTPRAFHTATTLQNGQVLVAGGGGVVPESAALIDRFDPLSGKFVGTGSMATGHTNGARNGHTATLVPDGFSIVVLSGGNLDNLGNPTGSVEFYQPGIPGSPGLLAPTQ
jgi:hypothetical protein